MGKDFTNLRYSQITKLDQFSIGNSTSAIEVSREVLKNIGSAIYFLRDCKYTLWNKPNTCTVVKIHDGKRKLKIRYNIYDNSQIIALDEFVFCCNGYKITESITLSDSDIEDILEFADTF